MTASTKRNGSASRGAGPADKAVDSPGKSAQRQMTLPASTRALGALLVLVLCLLATLLWGWLSHSSPVRVLGYAASGDWLREPLDEIHRGTALDQPTIGKFMLFPSALAHLACTSILLLRILVGAKQRFWRWGLCAYEALLTGLLLILFLPSTLLLVHYSRSVGVTTCALLGGGVCPVLDAASCGAFLEDRQRRH